MKKLFSANLWVQIITLPFIFVAILLLIGQLANFSSQYARLDKSTIKDTVEKYAIQCYASEGSYPPNLLYLEEHYGLQLDRMRYIYDYEIFASNVMPEITVLDNNGYTGKQ